MDRPLGGAERQWWMQSQRAACNIGLAACIDAPVDRKRFERAMTWLQARYPILAASLEVRDGEPHYVTRSAPPISVEWRECAAPGAWREPGAKATTTGFPDEGPFIRFIVCAGADATDVILCISHMLGDGLSMSQLMLELLRCLDEPDRPVVPVPDRGSMYDRAPRSYRGQWFPFVRHLVSLIAASPNDPARNARLTAGYRGRHEVAFRTIELTVDETERLRAASRAQKTSVQGALTGAMALAIGEHEARYGRDKIALHSPINVRALLEPPADEEIGNFAAGTTIWVSRQAALWDIARAAKADIDRAIERGEPFAHERLGIGTKRKTLRTKPRWLALRVWPDIGVTNLGVVKVPESPIGARVRELHVLVAIPVMQSLVAGIVTVNGKLFCDLSYCPGDYSHDEIARIAESARRQLESAMAPAPK